MLLLILTACLVNTELYERRSAELADADGDGTPAADDCDDTDPDIHPGASEHCDGVDEDCNGLTDDEAIDLRAWYPDHDGDGLGADEPVTWACSAPEGSSAESGDCDDNDASIPTDEEIPYDGKDNDCVGGDLSDVDGDGYDAEAAGGTDCDDGDATVHPDADETWENGATDNDCDGDRGDATYEYGADAWIGEAVGDRAGHRVSALSDVDGDGLAEFLVAAPYSGDDRGTVYLVDGPEPGPLAEETRVVAAGDGWLLGLAIDGGPDIDGDGIADLLIGGPGWGGTVGAAWLLSGAEVATATADVALEDAEMWTARGVELGNYAGATVSFLGDLDGDGIDEVAFSSAGASIGVLSTNGLVGIWTDTSSGGTLEDADIVLSGAYDGALAGVVLAAAGDQDDDGHGDFLVGYGEGIVAQVLPGGQTSIDPNTDAIGEVVEDGDVQAEPRMIGDVDGDGAPDLAVILDEGDVLVYIELASNPTLTTSKPATYLAMSSGGSYCWDLAALGDLDGDGRDETLIPLTEQDFDQTPSASILFGDSVRVGAELEYSELYPTAVSRRVHAGFGYRADYSDDVDGDGVPDILMGGPTDAEGAVDAGGVVTLPLPE